MKIALVYDRINKFGGAERLLLELHKIYPRAPLYTLVHNPDTAAWANKIKVIPSFFNKVKSFHTRHELLSPFAALAFETFNFDQFDIVISITSESAKAIITKPHTLHICYCLTPTRYLYSARHLYQQDIKYKLAKPLIGYFKFADLIYSSRPDYYLAISKTIQKRIKKYYHSDSEVIYPPINYKFWSKQTPPLSTTPAISSNSSPARLDSYYLFVSRLVLYKKIDLAIRVFNQLGKKLIIVGSGSQENYLKKTARPNIKFLGQVSDAKLKHLYQNAQALIFPQLEDFGLVPLESLATGTPVIAYNKGGASETVLNKQTGILFNKQTTKSLYNAILRFESFKHHITALKCRSQAKKFDRAGFYKGFSAKVKSLWQKHQTIYM